ncbi:hypothetical protein M2334_001318 [Sphingobium sp. B11D3D]|nr:hypothetical protein [Sphingobium sp. B12D2B]MCW2369119.1 hypothetical protein [Sphingobium sp. B11D3D]
MSGYAELDEGCGSLIRAILSIADPSPSFG